MSKLKCFLFFLNLKFLFLFFSLTSCSHFELSQLSSQFSTTTSTSSYYWNALLNPSKKGVLAPNIFLPSYVTFERLLEYSNSTDTISTLSDQCQKSLQQALEALSSKENWAVELFNSWAGSFPPTGALSGTLTDLGDFDQCLGLTDSAAISTQYCLLQYSLPMPRPRPKHHNLYHQTPNLLPSGGIGNNNRQNYLKNGSIYRKLEQVSSLFYYTNLQIAICLPATCSPEDVNTFASKGLIVFKIQK